MVNRADMPNRRQRAAPAIEPQTTPPAVVTGKAPSGLIALAVLVLLLSLTAVSITEQGSRLGGAAFVADCVGAVLAIMWGIRRYRPSVRIAWYLLAGAPLFGGIGMGLRFALADVGGSTVALVPDLVTLPAYLLLIGFLVTVVLARRGAGLDNALDCGLMAVSALLLSWALLIWPLVTTDASLALQLVNAAYPTISVAVLFLGALLAMTEVRAIPAFWILLCGWCCLAIGDGLYALAAVGQAPFPLWVANGCYAAFYALLAAAAVHPSMVRLTRPATHRVRGYGNSRSVAVGVALLVPAAIAGIRSRESAVEPLVDIALLLLLGALVLLRITVAVNRHATAEVRLERQANEDMLTGLPNRLRLTAHLTASLESARLARTGVGLLYMDLDQFKIVNDSWGHTTGEQLLTVVAARVTGAVRPAELVARVGGDEFAVVVTGVSSSDEVMAIGERLVALFDDPVAVESRQIYITASVGVAFAGADQVTVTAGDMIRESDTAMYRSKARGGATVLLFDESMRTETGDRIALEGSLREALERGEMRLHYQPIVNLKTGRPCGFEALMRWQHPDRGLVSPDEFIPVAEDTGYIVKLGRWALQQAMRDLSTWLPAFGPLTMSVNLSPRQLRDPHLVEVVRLALEDTGVPGDALCIEITESTLMEDAAATMTVLSELKHLGVRLSADDFGTGYSSLAYLRLFPFDQVKVDRSFVADLKAGGGDDDVIVGLVLAMARSLSLTTVAEGIETRTQRDRLIKLGADNGQGWLFSPGLRAAGVATYLEDSRSRALESLPNCVGEPTLDPAAA